MRAASGWSSLRNSAALGCLLALCGPALASPQLQFVKVTAQGYGPPTRLSANDTLGVRITDMPDNVELRVSGLVNHSPDRSYTKNQTTLLKTIAATELIKSRAAASAGAFVVSLTGVDLRDVLEVSASLSVGSGAPVGPPARLTLDFSRSSQAAPPVLQRVLTASSAMVDRLMNLYDVVRDTPDPRAIFTVSLSAGKVPTAPQMLPLERAQYRYLALSAGGNRLAWVTETPEGYELWSSPLGEIQPVKVASAHDTIATPAFADEATLLYVRGANLMIARIGGSSEPMALLVPTVHSISRIHSARIEGDRIVCVLVARGSDSEESESPYVVRIPVSQGVPESFRLASNPFYGAYSQLVEGAPFFFAGSEQGVEGIHYVQPENTATGVTTLFAVRDPGLVTIAANGGRLVFAGNP